MDMMREAIEKRASETLAAEDGGPFLKGKIRRDDGRAAFVTLAEREGLSLASLQALLRGRWRGNCHPGELGTALRKLGFKRELRWHCGSGFGALWYPPQ